ncbi:MAG: hypothetical protein ACQEXJ_04685 [Myxococcota bacterium]
MSPSGGEIARVDPGAGTVHVRFTPPHASHEAVAAAALSLTGRAWVVLVRDGDAVTACVTLRDADGLTDEARADLLETLAGDLVSAALWQDWAGRLRRRHRDRIEDVYRRVFGGGTPS